jgi:hypothetical protein
MLSVPKILTWFSGRADDGGRAVLYLAFALLACASVHLFAAPSSARLLSLRELGAQHAPASVPLDYIVTPHGYFHASCVHEVEDGATAQSDGSIRHADGTVSNFGLCAYPRYDRNGVAVASTTTYGEQTARRAVARDSTSTNASHYIEYSNQFTSSVGYLSATWTVPSNPVTSSGQTVYFFPGAQQSTIIQPVLGYIYGNGWQIASFNCCANGQDLYSTLKTVNPGDTIMGVMQGSNCSGNLCQNWTITTADSTNGVTTTLQTTPNEQFTLLLGGALEVYSVASCGEYPASGSVTISGLLVADTYQNPISPVFSNSLTTDTPQCGFQMNSSATTTQLAWNGVAAKGLYSASESGADNNMTLSAFVSPAPADQMSSGSFYVAAQVGSTLYFNNGKGWVPYTGNSIPAFASGLLRPQSFNILQGSNVSNLLGTNVYAGYGLNASDMINNQKYGSIYTIH